MEKIVKILGPNTSISGLEKFNNEYTDPDEVEEDEDDIKNRKPDDWKALFKGNIDDDFKVSNSLAE
jgi:hypothetical protein